MRISYKIRATLAVIACIVQCYGGSALHAQSQGTTGFDWIGSDPTNTAGQRCFPAMYNPSGSVFSQVVTSWIPPGSVNSRYQLKTFRSIAGIIGSNPSVPLPIEQLITTGRFQLSIYESLEALRNSPDTGYRARFRYEVGVPGVSHAPAPSCKVYAFGFLHDMPCAAVQTDLIQLAQQGRAEFRTAGGSITSAPLELQGSRRYFFAVSGYSTSVSPTLCFVRTNFANAANRSPVPHPSLSVPMNDTQCTEAGFPSTCLFVLAHSDYYWQRNTEPLCDPGRTFVNSTPDQSLIEPFLNPSADGSLPRTCGGATHMPCCERTFAAHAAFALGIRPKAITTYHGISIREPEISVNTLHEVCSPEEC